MIIMRRISAYLFRIMISNMIWNQLIMMMVIMVFNNNIIYSNNNHYNNIFVAADDIVSLQAVASKTYEKLLPCIEQSIPVPNRYLTKTWKLPDDAYLHYQELVTKTSGFRDIPMHEASGYSGPWVENHFISQFLNKPLDYFQGLIPLFIQFVDIHVYSFREKHLLNASIPEHSRMHEYLSTLLRKNVLYLAISQDDEGLGAKIHAEFPNILVLSAGGYGQVAIPLIKGELPFRRPLPSYATEVGFYGLVRPRLSRSSMIANTERALKSKGIPLNLQHSVDWMKIMENTLFNLAPRGFGRTSYRLAEIIQMGRIPIYMYDDYEWLPYRGTNASVVFGHSKPNFGLSYHAIDPQQAMKLANDILFYRGRPDLVDSMIQEVKAVRRLYTYEGLMEQITLFLQDPFGVRGGYLTCTALPPEAKAH